MAERCPLFIRSLLLLLYARIGFSCIVFRRAAFLAYSFAVQPSLAQCFAAQFSLASSAVLYSLA